MRCRANCGGRPPRRPMIDRLVAPLSDCESDDARLARLSQEAAAGRAEQNRELARLIQSHQTLETGIDAERGHLDQQRTVREGEWRSKFRRPAPGDLRPYRFWRRLRSFLIGPPLELESDSAAFTDVAHSRR
jgi:hypothetical protein